MIEHTKKHTYSLYNHNINNGTIDVLINNLRTIPTYIVYWYVYTYLVKIYGKYLVVPTSGPPRIGYPMLPTPW